MRACPACGAAAQPIHQVYAAEVQREDAIPDRLGFLRPPTPRAVIHGFTLGVLIWMSALVPFFAVNRFWQTCLPVWALTLGWIPIFTWARRKDHRLRRAYEARVACGVCGWIEGGGEAPSASTSAPSAPWPP